MEVVVLNEGSMCKVIPYGRIDSATSEEFESKMKDVLKTTSNIILDFKETEYISSTGLRVLLMVKKTLGDSGTFTIMNANESILEVLDLTGFIDILDVDNTTGFDPKEIKVVFFDVDGTLMDPDTRTISESTVRAIKAIQSHGIMAVVATGRYIVELEQLPVMDIGFNGYLTLNGNICLDEDKKMFAGNEIDQKEVEILENIAKAKRIPFVFIGEHKRYINYVNEVVIRTQLATNGTIPNIGEYNGEKIYQCIAFVDAEMRERLEDLLDQCSITSWNETGIDIIAKTGGKAAGIQKFLDRENLVRSEVMAFGDGENDMPMIKFAGIGVAMGNAGESVKRHADYVTDSVQNDGIEKALKHFGLI